MSKTSEIQQYRDLAFETLNELLDELSPDNLRKEDFEISNIYRELTNLPTSPNDNPYTGLFGIKSIKEHRDLVVKALNDSLTLKSKVVETDYCIDSFIRKVSKLSERPSSRAVYEGLYNLPIIPEVKDVTVKKRDRTKLTNLKMSTDGVNLLKEFEGCHLTAYPDPGSADGEPITIG